MEAVSPDMIRISLRLGYCRPWKDKTSLSSRNLCRAQTEIWYSVLFSASDNNRSSLEIPFKQETTFASLNQGREPSSLKKASGLRTLAVSLVTLKGIDHIYQNKWQLTLQGRPARPRESEEKMSLEAHQQLGSFALGWVLPLPDFWAGEHFLRTAAWANCLRPSQAQPSGRNGFGVVCFSAIKEPFLVLAFVLASLWRNNLPGAI